MLQVLPAPMPQRLQKSHPVCHGGRCPVHCSEQMKGCTCRATSAQRGHIFLIFAQDFSGLTAGMGCRSHQGRGSQASEALQDSLGLEPFSRRGYSAGLRGSGGMVCMPSVPQGARVSDVCGGAAGGPWAVIQDPHVVRASSTGVAS